MYTNSSNVYGRPQPTWEGTEEEYNKLKNKNGAIRYFVKDANALKFIVVNGRRVEVGITIGLLKKLAQLEIDVESLKATDFTAEDSNSTSDYEDVF